MSHMKKHKILIVDDEVLIARALSMVLKNKGYDVCTIAGTGEDAIKIAEEEKPDIVLMDISLPGEMDGITAGKTIKDRFNIPIIYMSGIYDEKVREEVGNPEPFEFLVKPMSKENVLKSIELGLQKFKP